MPTKLGQLLILSSKDLHLKKIIYSPDSFIKGRRYSYQNGWQWKHQSSTSPCPSRMWRAPKPDCRWSLCEEHSKPQIPAIPQARSVRIARSVALESAFSSVSQVILTASCVGKHLGPGTMYIKEAQEIGPFSNAALAQRLSSWLFFFFFEVF